MARTQADRRAETRARLLRAAAARFAADGIDGASVDAIAEDADRTSGSVYAHFASKEGLLNELVDSWKHAVVAVANAEIAAAPTPRERLAAIWHSFADPPGDEGRWLQLEHELWLHATRRPQDDPARRHLARRYHDAWTDVTEGLAAWDPEDRTSPVPDRAIGPLLVALLLGLEMQHRLDPEAVDDEVAIAGLAALLGVSADEFDTQHSAPEGTS